MSLASGSNATAPAMSLAPPGVDLYQGYSLLYAKQMWWFCAAFICTVGVFQYGSALINTLSRRGAIAHASQDIECSSRGRERSRLRRLPSAVVNAYRVVAFRWTLRLGGFTLNMAEVFITGVYLAAMFIWLFLHTTDFDADRYAVGYWANRAGTLATAQVTLMTALGTKNDIIGLVTGISHEKLNYAHRLIARVIWVLIWFHSAGWLVYNDKLDWSWQWLRAGVLGTVGFSVLILSSVRPVRQRCYEFFFITHFLMALVFLIGGYFHATFRSYSVAIWPALIIWALDRSMRFARLVLFNHLYFRFTNSSALDATVEALSPSYVRLRMARPAHFHWSPAQMAYLVMPIDTSKNVPATAVPEKCELSDSSPYWKELIFLVEVRGGFTKRLAAVAAEGEKVKIAIDGPYGNSPDLTNDNTVVLIAGESGVTHALSSFLSVINDVRDGKSVCTKVIFLWSIRDPSQIEWVSSTLRRAIEIAPLALSISIHIHVTNPSPASLPAPASEQTYGGESTHGVEGTPKTSEPPPLLNSPQTQVISGRADVRQLLRDEVAASTRRISVTVCASQGMVNSVRSALSFPVSSPTAIMNGEASVVLHIESFSYA